MNSLENSLEKRPDLAGSEMGLWDHLKELRSTLIRSILGVLVASIISYVYWRDIWRFLALPLKQKGIEVTLINTAPVEAFITSIKVAIVSGILFSSPSLCQRQLHP